MAKEQIKCCWNCRFSSYNHHQEKYICGKQLRYLARLELPTPTSCIDWQKSKTTEV